MRSRSRSCSRITAGVGKKRGAPPARSRRSGRVGDTTAKAHSRSVARPSDVRSPAAVRPYCKVQVQVSEICRESGTEVVVTGHGGVGWGGVGWWFFRAMTGSTLPAVIQRSARIEINDPEGYRRADARRCAEPKPHICAESESARTGRTRAEFAAPIPVGACRPFSALRVWRRERRPEAVLL